MVGGTALLLLCALAAPPSASATATPIPVVYRTETDRRIEGWTASRAALGRRLFRDPILSRDRTLSCQSCHDPARAFTDGRRTALGVGGEEGSRNTPTLINRALGETFFWDGRSASLEAQAVMPIENPREMALPIDEAARRLARDARYRRAFEDAFAAPPSRETIASALAAYERTIFSTGSAFDRHLAGEAGALTDAARRGLQLFGGKAACGPCHSGLNFTDESYHVLGVGDDEGRAAISNRPDDRGAFKTPTLREIARTAPYMHDGSLATLADVIDFYDRGGNGHPNLDPLIHPLGLTPGEKGDLVAFLESLSGRISEGAGPDDTPRSAPRSSVEGRARTSQGRR